MSRVNDGPHVAALLGGLFDTIRAEVTRDGLRPSHHRVLEAVPQGGADGAAVGEVAVRLGMTSQGCGQLVTRLVASGHLASGRGEADGRVRLVRRTPTGDAAVADLAADLARVEDRWRAHVGADRYDAFRAVLAELCPTGGGGADQRRSASPSSSA